MTPGKDYTLQSITEAYLKNETIKPFKHIKFVENRVPAFKDSYSMSELYNDAFAELSEGLWSEVLSAYKNILGEYKNAVPKFVVVGGGGMLANSELQTPFMDIAFKMVKTIKPELHTENGNNISLYEYIAPHGLYPNNNYLYTDVHKALCAHVFGISKEFVSKLKKHSK